MRRVRRGAMRRALLGSMLVWLGCAGEPPMPALDEQVLGELQRSLEQNHRSPEEYIVAQFDAHDVVFLGERHRLAHDVALVRNVIPLLHARGVYNLGIEFADYVDQPLIDRLLAQDEYEEPLARQIQFDQWPFWGYQDYIDIYKAAWELNRSLAAGTRPFRIVGLNCDADFSHLRNPADRQNPEIMRKVWRNGDTDKYMAQIIEQEFIDQGEKVLVYMVASHAYTRFRQPLYDVENDSLIQRNEWRTGNRIHKRLGERCFNIRLHSEWPAAEKYENSVLAADGYIDALIERLSPEKRRAGFDVVGTPFEELPGQTSYWKYGSEAFELGDYCDGYVIQMPLQDYRGVTVAEGFIHEGNRLVAIAQIANPAVKDTSRTADDLMRSLQRDTDIQRIYRRSLRGFQ